MLTRGHGLGHDNYTICPTVALTERVTYNDQNLQNPAYSITALPTKGTVTMDGSGSFTYKHLQGNTVAMTCSPTKFATR